MDNLLFITSNLMPVPAVKGGAVETLLQIVIEENEIYHDANIYILCKYNRKAVEIAKNYKYTKIFYYKSLKELAFHCIHDKVFLKYIWYKIRNSFHIKSVITSTNRYAFTAFDIAKQCNIDKIIVEGGVYNNYNILGTEFKREQIYAHFHRVVYGPEVSQNVYGNTISCSNYVRNIYVKSNIAILNMKNHVLMNCANEKNFVGNLSLANLNRIKSQLNITQNDFIVFFAGRVIPEKGIMELVDAVLNIKIGHIKLIVAGSSLYEDGEETEFMRAIRIKADSSNERIKCIGFIPNNQLIYYLSISNAWCIPSKYEEPAGLVIIEALLANIPIIMSGSGGMCEYANAECAVIAKRGDDFTLNIKNAILKLYNNPELCEQMRNAEKNK